MSNIHLIEKSNNLKIVDKDKRLWESYSWKISADPAKKLIGGLIYLHTAQDKPSHFGGLIVNYRFIEDKNDPDFGRVIFLFEAKADCKDVYTAKEGWGMEKKIVD